jgi:hypothetical protein
MIYLGESLRTFRTKAYLSAAVMLGVAAENVLLKLTEAIKSALTTEDRQRTFEQAIRKAKAKQMHDEIMARLKSPLTPLPNSLNEVIAPHIDGMYNLIRITRNDAGHPTGRTLEQSEVDGLMRMFPPYCKTAHALMTWLGDNRI